MRNVQLPGPRTLRSPEPDERAVLRECDHSRIGALAVRDKHVSIPSKDKITGTVEGIGGVVVAGDAFLPECQQQATIRTELEDLVQLAFSHPDVVFAIDAKPMGRLEHSIAPRPQPLTRRIEHHHLRGFTALEDVDGALRIDVDGGHRSPLRARRELGPIVDELIGDFRCLESSRGGCR